MQLHYLLTTTNLFVDTSGLYKRCVEAQIGIFYTIRVLHITITEYFIHSDQQTSY